MDFWTPDSVKKICKKWQIKSSAPVIAAQPTLFVFYLSDGMKKETEFLLAEILTFRKESARERMRKREN